MTRTYTVYKISCPTGRAYVGCTCTSVAQRVEGHRAEGVGRNAVHMNPNRIGAAITRFGLENMVVEELATAQGPQAAAELETALIAQHGTLYPDGYNMRARSSVQRGVKSGLGESLVVKPAKVVRDWLFVSTKPHPTWPPLQPVCR